MWHFLPSYLTNNPKNQNFEKMKKCLQILLFYTWVPKVTIISCMVPGYMEHKGQTFLSFWTIFCPFTPLTTQKPKFLKKWKKNIWRYYHFKICTINDNHMMYGSWDMETNRQNFLSFWTIFCTFDHLSTWKIKILKQWKKCLRISSFYKSVWKIMIICYTVPEICLMMDVIIIFHFGLFFALLSS